MDKSQHEKIFQRWFLVKGDTNLRLAYPLNAESVVFDLGGYHGDWAHTMVSLYGCRCHVFEPVVEHAEHIRQRCGADERFAVHDFAVGRGDGIFQISLDGDASSSFTPSGTRRVAKQKDIVSFVLEQGISRIDLMKINIEGAEYDLLNYMIGTGLIGMVRDVQVQFHTFVEDAERKRAAIRGMLSLTHDCIYDFPFVWESWSAR